MSVRSEHARILVVSEFRSASLTSLIRSSLTELWVEPAAESGFSFLLEMVVVVVLLSDTNLVNPFLLVQVWLPWGFLASPRPAYFPSDAVHAAIFSAKSPVLDN